MTSADRRRSKGRSQKSLVEAGKILEDEQKIEYYCREDAKAEADRLRSEGTSLHYCDCTVKEEVTYSRGRPPKNGERKVSKTMYVLEGKTVEKTGEIERLKGGRRLLRASYQRPCRRRDGPYI